MHGVKLWGYNLHAHYQFASMSAHISHVHDGNNTCSILYMASIVQRNGGENQELLTIWPWPLQRSVAGDKPLPSIVLWMLAIL